MMSSCCFLVTMFFFTSYGKNELAYGKTVEIEFRVEAQETGQHNTITVSGQEPMCIEPND